MNMHKVIIDCDNTMGVKGKDIDDGLSLVYLLGRSDVEILGVTSTYGNSTTDVVYSNTKRMLHELGFCSIPVLKGAGSKHKRRSAAARFLAGAANKYSRKLTLLATGSLTNLLAASFVDSDFFLHVERTILMGGITEPLLIGGRTMDELNFSCDPEAAYSVLRYGKNVSVITGNLCLQAHFNDTLLRRLNQFERMPIFQFLKKKIVPWLDFFKSEFKTDGIYTWDLVAAVYLTSPDLFKQRQMAICSTVEDLQSGLLRAATGEKKHSSGSCTGSRLNVPPEIRGINAFWSTVFDAWKNVRPKPGENSALYHRR
jgi:inosine-uridine nucleoside N-ribohydrolase